MKTGLAPLAATLCLLATPSYCLALGVTGYSPTVNDRFQGTFPGAPVPNSDPAFVGAGLDFSGVGWSASTVSKGFALLSPRHYIAALHYDAVSTLRFQGDGGTLYSYQRQSSQATGYGAVLSGPADLALGTLTTTVASSTGITPYAIYDGPVTASTTAILYGPGGSETVSPRVGQTVFAGSNTTSPSTSYTLTPRTQVQFQTGDSGSPAFALWTDPTGQAQLALVGSNASYTNDNLYNVINYIVRDENISVMNTMMADEGYALRFVAPVNTTWSSTGNTALSTGGNWSAGGPGATRYLGFATTSSSVLAPDLGGGTVSARGLVFSPGSAGFHFANGTFALDRGGLHNYDPHAQRFDTDFLLTEAQ